jgi:hypothetical protein
MLRVSPRAGKRAAKLFLPRGGRTYERKLAAWTEAVEAADEAFAMWIGRRFGMSEMTKA